MYNLAIYIEGTYSHRVYGFDTIQQARAAAAELTNETTSVKICGYWE